MSKKRKPFILSDATLNSKRIVVPTESINLDSFSANPVMLYNHVRGNVIGRWENLRVENEKLIADPVFDDTDEDVAKISGKVDRGFIKGASIGIRNVKAEELTHDDGEPYWKVISCELREASVCDIPANAGALMLFDESDNAIDLSDVELADLFQTKIKKTTMDKKKLASTLGLSDDATELELNEAISVAISDQKELKTLKASIAAQNQQKAIELTDEAIKEGRLAKEAKEAFLKVAEFDFASFETAIKGLPKAVSLVDLTKAAAVAAVKVGADRKDWKFSDWQQKDSKGLEKLMTEDPEAFKKLYSEEFAD